VPCLGSLIPLGRSRWWSESRARSSRFRDVEQLVRKALEYPVVAPKVLKPLVAPPAWIRELEERMRARLGPRWELQNRPGFRGSIVIDYFNRADLDRLCQILAPRETI